MTEPIKDAISDHTPLVVEKKSRINFKLIGGIVAGIIVGVVATLIVREIMSDDDTSAIIEGVKNSIEGAHVEEVTFD